MNFNDGWPALCWKRLEEVSANCLTMSFLRHKMLNGYIQQPKFGRGILRSLKGIMKASLLLNRVVGPRVIRAAFAGTLAAVLLSCSGTVPGGGNPFVGGAQGQISITPVSVNFGSVAVGSSKTQNITLQNTSSIDIIVSDATLTGSGFSVSGLTLPFTLAADQSSTFAVTFVPSTNGATTGSLSIVSDAIGSPTILSITGSGTGGGSQLSLQPASIDFGNVIVGSSQAQAITLSNAGPGTVTIFQANVTGADFSISGLTIPLFLGATQTTGFSVTFTPTADGFVTGSVTLTSDALNSPTTLSLAGTGLLDPIVDVFWDASSSQVDGYNVYRSTQQGGPYTNKLNQALVEGAAFSDSTVQSGATYFYVVTAVDASSAESITSNEATAVVP